MKISIDIIMSFFISDICSSGSRRSGVLYILDVRYKIVE
jgi:hypothetical protein